MGLKVGLWQVPNQKIPQKSAWRMDVNGLIVQVFNHTIDFGWDEFIYFRTSISGIWLWLFFFMLEFNLLTGVEGLRFSCLEVAKDVNPEKPQGWTWRIIGRRWTWQIRLCTQSPSACTMILSTWALDSKLVGGFKYVFFSPRSLGKISFFLTNIFQMGWNHQLEKMRDSFWWRLGKYVYSTLLILSSPIIIKAENISISRRKELSLQNGHSLQFHPLPWLNRNSRDMFRKRRPEKHSWTTHPLSVGPRIAKAWHCPKPDDFDDYGCYAGAGTVGSTEVRCWCGGGKSHSSH